MKALQYIVLVCLLTITGVWSQEKYATKTGTISFEASVPSFEPVAAKHENVSALLNTNTGEFAALALVNGFRFEIALMEEHFNENYMESSQFPKALFKGVIKGFDLNSISTQPQELEIEGSLVVHGVTKPFTTKVIVNRLSGKMIHLETTFTLNPRDFNIDIPKIVQNKIAEEVNVHASFDLKI